MDRLIQLLGDCEALLRDAGEDFWAGKIRRLSLDREEPLPAHRVEEVLSWFGGMGSFNDLILSQYNGHAVEERDEMIVNCRLRELQHLIYLEAERLSKE